MLFLKGSLDKFNTKVLPSWSQTLQHMLDIFILIWGCFHCIIIRSRGQVYQSMTQKHWEKGFWVEHHLFDYLPFHKEFNHLWTTKLWIYLYHLIINEYIPINQLNDKANEYDKIENKSSCKVKRSWCQVIDQKHRGIASQRILMGQWLHVVNLVRTSW